MVALRGVKAWKGSTFVTMGREYTFGRRAARSSLAMPLAPRWYRKSRSGIGAVSRPWRFHCVDQCATEKKTLKSWP